MLATTQPEDIPQTIRSRCQHFSFRAVGFEEILNQLQGPFRAGKDRGRRRRAGAAGRGRRRVDARCAFDPRSGDCFVHWTADGRSGAQPGGRGALRSAGRSDAGRGRRVRAKKVLRLVDQLISEGHSPTHFARQMVRFLRNAVVAKIAGADSSLLQISSDERQRVARVAELFERRRSGAASADHAAHAQRTRLPAGTALPSGTGPVEDGARAAFAAARAIAERKRRVRGGQRAAGKPSVVPDIRRTDTASGRSSPVSHECFAVRGGFGAEERIEAGAFGRRAFRSRDRKPRG